MTKSIIPILVNNPGNVEFFPRPVRTCPEHYAVIRFRKKFYYINQMSEVLIDIGPLNFTKAEVPIFSGDNETLKYKSNTVTNLFTENQDTHLGQTFIDDELDLRSLERFALDGLDQAAIIILTSVEDEQTTYRVRNYRSRYWEIENTSDENILTIIQDFSLISQQVLDMPVSHYNLWLAYLKKEQDGYKRNQSLAEAKNYK